MLTYIFNTIDQHPHVFELGLTVLAATFWVFVAWLYTKL